MRARSAVLLAVPLGLACGLVGCRKEPPHGPASDNPTAGAAKAEVALQGDDPNADVSPPLFPPAKFPEYPSAPRPGTDPIVIANCTVQYEDRQTVSAEVDGKIDLIAIPMPLRADKSGVHELKLPDGTVITHDPKNPKRHPRIVFNPRDQVRYRSNPENWIPHYAFREGEVVAADTILCLVDDSMVVTKMSSAAKIKKASEDALREAEAGLKLTDEKIGLGKNSPGVAPIERLNDQITRTRFAENVAQAHQAIAKAEADLEDATVTLAKHRIRSRVEGIIRNVAKRPGEFVRAGEKIFEIQSTEKIRLEGNLDVQYADRVRRNMAVTIEPAVPNAPVRNVLGHRREVAGVAVTGTTARPLVVSAGLDGAVLVWEPNLAGAKDVPAVPHNLPHPVGVRCVAATPPGSKVVLAVTGADDGKVRIWDLADPARLLRDPRAPADAHAAGVTAVAVSPDGKYAATAAGREVFVWDLAAAKKLYALPESHRDGITSLAFTPQCELVTASKDRTLKRWKLGAAKAAVLRTIDHRSGAVDVLGVSPDGGRVLFDQDKTRLDLVNLSDAQTVGQLTNVGPSVAFATLAVFGPDYADPATPDDRQAYSVLTAGGEGDLKGGLQVWLVPKAGGRGAEVARLITPGRVAVTCAAFSQRHGKDPGFLVAGTAAGTLHVWTRPNEAREPQPGVITNIDPTDPRYATIRVEMDNKGLGLRDRTAATVIVHPGQ